MPDARPRPVPARRPDTSVLTGIRVLAASCHPVPTAGVTLVSVLLGAPPEGVELDAAEQAAIGVLADTGLVPPLRLRRAVG